MLRNLNTTVLTEDSMENELFKAIMGNTMIIQSTGNMHGENCIALNLYWQDKGMRVCSFIYFFSSRKTGKKAKCCCISKHVFIIVLKSKKSV